MWDLLNPRFKEKARKDIAKWSLPSKEFPRESAEDMVYRIIQDFLSSTNNTDISTGVAGA